MPVHSSRIRLRLLAGAAFILAVLAAVPFLVTPLINTPAVKTWVTQKIKADSGIDVSPGKIELHLAPRPGIRLEHLDLRLPRGIRLIIPAAAVDINLPKLLQRKLSVDRIHVQTPEVRFSGSGVGGPPGTGGKERSLTGLIPMLYAWLPESQGDLMLTVDQLTSGVFGRMDLSCSFRKQEKTAELSAAVRDIRIENTMLPFLHFDILKAGGMTLALRLDRSGTISGKVGLSAVSLSAPKGLARPLAARSLALEVSLSDNEIRARLLPAPITYPEAVVEASFHLNEGQKKAAVTFGGKAVDIAQAREACLPLLSGLRVSDHLFDILRSGKAPTVTVGFESGSLATLFGGDTLKIRGKAESATVKIPRTPLSATGVDALVTMDKGILHIEPSRGRISSARILGGVLDIDLIEHHEVPFSGAFPLDVQLHDLPATLRSLLPDTALARELSKVTHVEGRAKGVLTLHLPPGHKDLAVTVTADEIQAVGEYDRIPLPIRIDRGKFALQGEDVTLKDVSATLGRNPVTDLNVRFRLGETPWLFVENACARINAEDVMPWLGKQPGIMDLIKPAREIAGLVVLDRLTVDGPMFSPSRWAVSAAGTGEDVALGVQGHPKAISAVSGAFDIHGHHVAVTGLNALIEDAGWLDFAIPPEALGSIRLPLKVEGSRMEKTDDWFQIHAELAAQAGPKAIVEFDGHHLTDLILTRLTLKDPPMTDVTVLPYQAPDKPRINFKGDLDTRTLEKLLIPGSSLSKRLSALTAGTPFTVSTDSRSDIHLSTDKLNLDALFPGKELPEKPKPSARGDRRPLFSQKAVFFKAGELTFHGRTFTRVDSRIQFDPDATRVDIQEAGLCGVRGKGRVTLLYEPPEPTVSTTFSITGQDDQNIANAVACLFKTENIITGDYSAAMDLAGIGDRSRVLHQQNGTLHFHAENGRIFKATLLSRILSVINILSETDLHQEGFAYRTFTVDAAIKDSVIQLDKVYIDGENMAIVASGWLDPLKKEMDLTFLVAPFKTIDTIIQHIPVINTVLSGRLVSVPVRASGSILDPTVVPLAPTAVGKGLLNMLTDLVKAPARLIQSVENQGSDPKGDAPK